MNYNTIEEILSSGITNMTVFRDNIRLIWNIDETTGEDWFKFNEHPVSEIYISSESFIGFNSSSKHLNINQRNANTMYSLYREEGTLYNFYKFLKIRCKGYADTSYTYDKYALEYDIILWDTGDISLHMVSIPTSNNNGVYSLVASSTYTYTVSTSSPDVTFKKTNDGFEVLNGIVIERPIDRYYLVRDGETIYSISNSSLSSLGTVEVTSNLFLNSGYNPILNGMLDLFLLSGLSNPELLCWQETNDDATKFVVQGTPTLPQTIIYDSETIPDGSAIKIIEAMSTKDVLFTITFDGGATWKYHNGVTWTTAETISEGMNPNTLKSITEPIWAEVITSNIYQIRCALTSTTSSVEKIAVGYV